MLKRLFIATVLCITLLQQRSGASSSAAFDKPAFEAYIRFLLLWGPEVRVEIDDPKPSVSGLHEVQVRGYMEHSVRTETFFIAKDSHKIIRGTLLDIAENPFDSVRARLRTEGQPTFGPAGAPIVVIVFSDFQCPFCKMEADELRNELPKEYPEQVRVVFKELPIAQLHPWAMPAAVTGRCIFHQSQALFWEYHDWIFEQQSEITVDNLQAKVAEAMKGKGLNQEELASCINAKTTSDEINRSIEEAGEFGVTGTPYLFVNGRKMAGGPWPSLRAAIEAELAHQKKTKAPAAN